MKEAEGYFTVEAALLFPFVMGVVLLVIYLLFFQYDRCLMEQSAAVLSMRGCTIQTMKPEELAAKMIVQDRNEKKPYVAWETQDAEIRIKGNTITVTREGNLRFPFKGLDFWNGGNNWGCATCFESHRIRPVFFIRNYRKLGGN